MDVYETSTPENRGGSHLTKEDVLNIRQRYEINKEDKNIIYKDYSSKIGKAGFKKILNYYTWKDIRI